MAMAMSSSCAVLGMMSRDTLSCKNCALHGDLWYAARDRLPSLRIIARNQMKCRAFFEQQQHRSNKQQQLNKQQEQNGVVSSLTSTVIRLIRDVFKAVQKPALALLVIGLLMSQSPEDAFAASGGRVGGRSFSSGGGSSRTYSVPRSGSVDRSFSFSVPYAAPSPFFGGGGGLYFAPAYGVGFGGSGLFLMLLLGFMAFQLVTGFLVDRNEGSSLSGATKTSVLKLQVGLLGRARSLQRDLDQLAARADTTSPQGLHYILTETVLALMRHPDYCISGTSSSEIKRSVEAGEAKFNQLSLEERGKFDEETLVSVDNIRKRSASRARPGAMNNEYIVVTLLVAAQGEFKLPPINSNADLRSALSKLGSVPSDQILAVEVLWTPQDESDALTERELLRDYPLLSPL